MKQENPSNPSIDGRIRLYVRVIDHTPNVLCINLDDQVLHPNDIDTNCSQCSEQPVQLHLGLGVP